MDDALEAYDQWMLGLKPKPWDIESRLAAEVRALRARAERAERVAVWAAREVDFVSAGNRGRTEIHFAAPDGVPESKTCDGTDAEIYRVLEAEALAWE